MMIYYIDEVILMPDYKEMYETMVRASEKALNIIIDAQRKCEEKYLAAEEKKKRRFSTVPVILRRMAGDFLFIINS